MKQSLTGLIENATRRIKHEGDPRGYAFALARLHDHLKEVKDQHDKGKSAEVLTEFFNLYVFEEPTDAQA